MRAVHNHAMIHLREGTWAGQSTRHRGGLLCSKRSVMINLAACIS